MASDFEIFIAGSAAALRNLAYALTGSGADADDLLQVTLERMARAWRSDVENPVAYARRVMVRAYSSERRRARWRREVGGVVPELPHSDAAGLVSDDRIVLFRALAELPRRQREAVVLRYLEDMPVADVAQAMGCSEGNVKRSAFDGLRTLRVDLESEFGSQTTRGVR